MATELLERAAEANASVHAAGKDGWLGRVGRCDARRGETRLCSGLVGRELGEMLVCVAASGERCCSADLLDVGFETCFEREPRGSETHYCCSYAGAHVFESEIASERPGIFDSYRMYRRVGSEASILAGAAAAIGQPAASQ